MAIIVDKDGNVVTVENEPEASRSMFPNLQEGKVSDIQINGRSIVDPDGVVNFAPVEVSGTTPAITAQAGSCYICGECATLNITLPDSGCVNVRFESGSTPTVLTVTPTQGGAVHFPEWFDNTSLAADTVYEMSFSDGFGVVMSWPV